MSDVSRNLLSDPFTDVFDAFEHAAAATRLGWPVVFVGRCERYKMWFVWVAYPGLDADAARQTIEAERRVERLREDPK